MAPSFIIACLVFTGVVAQLFQSKSNTANSKKIIYKKSSEVLRKIKNTVKFLAFLRVSVGAHSIYDDLHEHLV